MSWFGSWLGGGSGGGGGVVVPADALTAGAIIEAAREKHPAFTRTAIPLPVALSALTDLQAELHGVAQQREPFYVVATYEHPLSTFDASVPVPAHTGIVGGTVHLTTPAGATEDLSIVNQAHRFDPPRRFAAELVNGELALIGDAAYWADATQVDVRYAPVPAALSAADEALILPASARFAIVAMLAVFMGHRCRALRIPVEMGQLTSTATRAVNSWLDTVAGVGTARPTRIRTRL